MSLETAAATACPRNAACSVVCRQSQRDCGEPLSGKVAVKTRQCHSDAGTQTEVLECSVPCHCHHCRPQGTLTLKGSLQATCVSETRTPVSGRGLNGMWGWAVLLPLSLQAASCAAGSRQPAARDIRALSPEPQHLGCPSPQLLPLPSPCHQGGLGHHASALAPAPGTPSPHPFMGPAQPAQHLSEVSCRPALILSCAAPSVRTRSPSAPPSQSRVSTGSRLFSHTPGKPSARSLHFHCLTRAPHAPSSPSVSSVSWGARVLPPNLPPATHTNCTSARTAHQRARPPHAVPTPRFLPATLQTRRSGVLRGEAAPAKEKQARCPESRAASWRCWAGQSASQLPAGGPRASPPSAPSMSLCYLSARGP